jgi:hypothetical protein
LAIAHSFTFRTYPAPPQVIYYELVLLPRAQPSTPEAVERATNLYMAFQEYGEVASEFLGLSWHVTPEPDGHGGFGTKVEVLGQFMGDIKEFEKEISRFEDVIRLRGVGEFSRGQRELSKCLEGLV